MRWSALVQQLSVRKLLTPLFNQRQNYYYYTERVVLKKPPTLNTLRSQFQSHMLSMRLVMGIGGINPMTVTPIGG